MLRSRRLKSLHGLVTLAFVGAAFQGCSETTEVELSVGSQSAVLLPIKGQSCIYQEAWGLFTFVGNAGSINAGDVNSKHFTIKRPKLKLKDQSVTFEVIQMSIRAEKGNSCGLNVNCTYGTQDLAYAFGKVTASTLNTGSGFSRYFPRLQIPFNGKIYGEETTGYSECKKNLDNPGGVARDPTTPNILDPNNPIHPGVSCKEVEGADICPILCGGASAAKENCTASVEIQVMGIKTDEDGVQIPVRTKTKMQVINVLNDQT